MCTVPFLTFSARIDFTKQYNKMKQALTSQPATTAHAGGGVQKTTVAKERSSNQLEALSKYANRIHLGILPITVLIFNSRAEVSSSVSADIKRSAKKASGERHKQTDKSDRATVEQVLDPRTRIILFKMLNRNIISEINGCISTGKEASTPLCDFSLKCGYRQMCIMQ